MFRGSYKDFRNTFHPFPPPLFSRGLASDWSFSSVKGCVLPSSLMHLLRSFRVVPEAEAAAPGWICRGCCVLNGIRLGPVTTPRVFFPSFFLFCKPHSPAMAWLPLLSLDSKLFQVPWLYAACQSVPRLLVESRMRPRSSRSVSLH